MSNKPQDANRWIHTFIIAMENALYKPSRRWFQKFIFGALLTCSTVSSWIRAVDEKRRYRKFYHHLSRLGTQIDAVQSRFLDWLVENLPSEVLQEMRIRLVADDSPTKRSGPKIEGAGWHHDPTSPNVDTTTCYGHSWVVLSIVLEHPFWGTISIPLSNRLYIRRDDLKKIEEYKRPEFKTKLEFLNEMVAEVSPKLKALEKPVQLLFDRGYVSEDVFTKMAELGVEIVTRFKSNTNLYKLPEVPKEKRRGRPQKYGDSMKADDLMQDRRRRLSRTTVFVYGREELIEYKSAILTSHVSDGKPIHVVVSRIVKQETRSDGTVKEKIGPQGTFVSTNVHLTPEEIIESYSKRFSIEEMFKDLKEVCGLGKQQVRNLESNLACFQILAMNYAIVELWAWDKDATFLTRHRPPWDDIARRPSHKNKRMALQTEEHWAYFSAKYAKTLTPKILNDLKKRLFEQIVAV